MNDVRKPQPRMTKMDRLMQHGISPFWTTFQIEAAYNTLLLLGESVCKSRGVSNQDDIADCIQDAILRVLTSDIEFPNPLYDRQVFIKNTLVFAVIDFQTKRQRREYNRKRYAEVKVTSAPVQKKLAKKG